MATRVRTSDSMVSLPNQMTDRERAEYGTSDAGYPSEKLQHRVKWEAALAGTLENVDEFLATLSAEERERFKQLADAVNVIGPSCGE